MTVSQVSIIVTLMACDPGLKIFKSLEDHKAVGHTGN
jgi:hypothetical protein